MASHRFWTDRLSEHLDGELPADEAGAVEEHLAACADCRRVAEELGEVRRRARALAGVEPPRDLWPDIRRRLDAQADVVDLTLHLDPPTPPVVDGARSGTRGGVLRAAAVVALLAATGLGGWAARGAVDGSPGLAGSDPGTGVEAAFAAASPRESEALGDDVAALERLLAAAPADLDPETVRILRENLVLIRRAVAESRAALEVDPDNAYVRSHLEGAMARQRAFVRQASELLAADD